MAAPESSRGEAKGDWKHDSSKPKTNTMAKHNRQIKWTPERLEQAIAMKTRWQAEDMDEVERQEEFRLIWADFCGGEPLQKHLEFWLYVHDKDLFLKWTQD